MYTLRRPRSAGIICTIDVAILVHTSPQRPLHIQNMRASMNMDITYAQQHTKSFILKDHTMMSYSRRDVHVNSEQWAASSQQFKVNSQQSTVNNE
jgi:hypothetical protein